MASESLKRRFEFANPEGTTITFTLRGPAPKQWPLQLAGPHGSGMTLELASPLSEEQQIAFEKLLVSRDLSDLAEHERESLANARAIMNTGQAMAGRQGPIVRFDCTWVTWDEVALD